ncbi:MAG: PH domain-containing protein [Sarcina sp.]
MGLYDKLMGKGSMITDSRILDEYLLPNEQIIMGFKFIRDSIVLTTLGIYMIDVQGMTGKKVEVKFIPGKAISNVSFETAGTFDLDVDIKIGVQNNTAIGANGVPYNAPISFKVPSAQSNDAKQIVKLVKQYYLC